LLVDGFAVEGLAEDFADGGKAVEPFGEDASGDVAREALVEVFADGDGETGDFTGSGHGDRGLVVD
jgi:hypothetical protein